MYDVVMAWFAWFDHRSWDQANYFIGYDSVKYDY